MPKDDTSSLLSHPTNGTESFSADQKLPLKRGDACLYCRRRRIRCSATKPTCEHCRKLGRECVYDTGKPVSRVKQLEEKVAELEDMLKGGSQPSSHSGGSIGDRDNTAPLLEHHSSSGLTASSSASDLDIGNIGSSTGYAYTFDSGSVSETVDIGILDSLNPGGTFDATGLNMFASFGTSIFDNQGYGNGMNVKASGVNGGFQQGAMSTSDQSFDFSMLDPGFASLVNSFEDTSTGQAQPQPQVQGQAVPLQNQSALPSAQPTSADDFDLFGSTGLTPFLEDQPDSHVSESADLNGASDFFANSIDAPIFPSDAVPYHAYVTEFTETPSTAQSSTFSAKGGTPALTAQVQNSIGARGAPLPVNVPTPRDNSNLAWRTDQEWDTEAMPLVGGWFDAADLPHVARDHLLDLYFSGMRLFGQEFHIPRFYASLSLPPAKRPHPCVLYAMYLLASRVSTSAPIRALESHFYSIASRQLEEAIAHADRLVDAVRAAAMLAVYKYSLGRYHEGYMAVGQAARLAISCGLHQIPSSVFKPSNLPRDGRADLVDVMRQRSFCIPPPIDAIDLGERIWTFWSVFGCDRAGSISAQWPPAMPDEIVITPYPRPLHEYELGLVTTADDVSLNSLYNPSPMPRLSQYADSAYNVLRLQGLALLERSSKLMYLEPERNWLAKLRETSCDTHSFYSTPGDGIDEYLSYQNYTAEVVPDRSGYTPPSAQKAAEATTNKGWMRTAKIRTPQAFAEVRLALVHIEHQLPLDRRTNWEVWDGQVQQWHFERFTAAKEAYTLHFILGCAWMFLFDVFSFNAENQQAVSVARRLTWAVRAVAGQPSAGDMDVFIAMTWSFTVKILIREVKRLHSLGNKVAARPIEEDVETIVQALKLFGKRYGLATMQAARAERYSQSTAEDMAFMQGDKMDGEQHILLK